jgi:hypothetical protein
MLFEIQSDIAPTGPGLQPYNRGGSIVMWISRDEGRHWQKARELTRGCELNQFYPRRPKNANPGFYAFWADGNGRKPSKSNLYFSDKNGNIFMLSVTMNKSLMKPQHVFKNK